MGGISKARKEELRRMYPKGCAAPTAYCEWHEWAEAQALHGLSQATCGDCGRFRFPQELNALGSCGDQPDCRQFVKRNGRVRRSVNGRGDSDAR